MGRNRLAELQANSKYVKQSDIEANKPQDEDGANADTATGVEMQPLKMLDKDMSASTADFFETFDENVVANIDKIKRNVEEVKLLQKRILVSVKADEKDAAENRMNDLVEENKRLSRKIQTTLKSEKGKIEERLSKQPSPIKKWANKNKVEEKIAKRKTEMRMRQMQIDSQSSRFFNIWNEYNLNQANYRDKSKELLVRRCKIANNQYNDEQIESMLEEGKTDVFNECILSQMKSAQQQLTELQDRHDEFIKLERSIKEVHDMFLEIANLVTQQGEMVDNIMQNVMRAGEDVERGRDHLNKAEKYAVSSRKMKVILTVVAIIVFLIILLVILSELGAFSSGNKSESKITIIKEIVYVYPDSTTSTTTTAATATTTITTATTSNSLQILDKSANVSVTPGDNEFKEHIIQGTP